MKNSLRSIVLRLVALSMLVVAPLAPAHAAIVSTEQAISMSQRSAVIANVAAAALNRADVREQLVALGVDPDQAAQRVSALTPDELAALDGHLQALPAGGSLLAVLGILLVVLIVLDMLGVTNVFSKI